MVSDRKMFISLDETERGMINTSCGANTLEIKGKGSVSLNFFKKPVILHDVLLAPKITVNLISLHRLLLDNCKVNFDLNQFVITKDNETSLSGNYHNNLPVVKLEPVKHQSHLILAEKLHKSLGHVSYSRIRNKLGIPVKPPEICRACAVSKVTCSSYKHRSSRASRPFEELHLDLIGPISPASREGDRYILTVVDSITRYCSATPINQKSDIINILSSILDFEAKRFGYYPSVLHSDRGGEFINSLM